MSNVVVKLWLRKAFELRVSDRSQWPEPELAVIRAIQGTADGGGGAVASVNGYTGVVVLTAASVGADPAGSAATAQSAAIAASASDATTKANAAQAAAEAHAASDLTAHVAAVDPHPQYTTAGEAAAAAPVQSVAGRAGNVTLSKGDVGLSNVDNTPDASKPVSSAQAAADADALASANAYTDAAVAGVSAKTRRYDEAGNYQYMGSAPSGSGEGAAVWTIYRLAYANGAYVETKSATGVTWAGRAGHTYT